MGHACADCLRLDSPSLAAEIDQHVEVLSVESLTVFAKLARSGKLRRPSDDEFTAANDAARRNL
jgi:hypothetical protein